MCCLVMCLGFVMQMLECLEWWATLFEPHVFDLLLGPFQNSTETIEPLKVYFFSIRFSHFNEKAKRVFSKIR